MDFQIRPIDEKWFDESTPANYCGASAGIGSGETKKVIVVADSISCDATISIAVALTANADLSVSQSGNIISVVLGTGGVAGTADNTKNTAALVAAAINDNIDGLAATATPEVGALSADDITGDDNIEFTTGHYGTPCPESGLCLESSGTYYVCIEADNSNKNDNWRSFSLSSY